MSTVSNGHPLRHAQKVSLRPGTTTRQPAGAVSDTGRWFSRAWWIGHHEDRSTCGEFDDRDGAACKRGRRAAWKAERGKGGPLPARRTRARQGRGPTRADAQAAYTDYLAARREAAEKALRGARMVTPAGAARGITDDDFFKGGRPPMRYATDELRAFLGDDRVARTSDARGRSLTLAEFTRQYTQRAAS